jgi:anthranilate phosphoribosyltransferase
MIKNYLEKVIAKENLTIKEAAEVMLLIMNGEVNNSQLAGFLTGFKSKGEPQKKLRDLQTQCVKKV